MGALVDHLRDHDVYVEHVGGRRLKARGCLTDDLRRLIRTRKADLLAELAADEPAVDPGALRRRSRALAILAENPTRRLAVVAEAGDPARVAVAIRGVAVGEVEIAVARYDHKALLELLQEHDDSG